MIIRQRKAIVVTIVKKRNQNHKAVKIFSLRTFNVKTQRASRRSIVPDAPNLRNVHLVNFGNAMSNGLLLGPDDEDQSEENNPCDVWFTPWTYWITYKTDKMIIFLIILNEQFLYIYTSIAIKITG